ncbi:MAG: thioredoxin family protein [Hyphomonadaceae bacterium]|nr:thioredoxin family protein [Hyphomonadaceae bacterium]
MIRTVFLALAAFFAFASPAFAQLPGQPLNAQHTLHSARAAVAPGETFTIILRQQINEGWHTYWRNPGDSGEPTQLTWQSPNGWQAGEIQWPTPEAIPFATLVNFGYEGEILYPIELTAPANARVGDAANFTVEIYALVCADICIPETSIATLSVPIAAQGRDDPQWAPRIAEAVAALPRREQGVDARITAGDPARISVTLPNASAIRNVRFFPFSADVLVASEPQNPRVGAAGASFELRGGIAPDIGQTPVQGVVAYEIEQGGAWVHRGVEIEAQPGEPLADTDAAPAPMSSDYPLAELEGAAAPSSAAPMDVTAVLLAMGLAFLGGLILNIMPCVLPVLSVKALQFAGGGHASETRKHGFFYFAGVMATFLALAGALIALRGAGEAVGWGFQLQAPWVTSALALLFFAIGLNLLGVFEIGGSLQNAGGELTQRGGSAGAFFTGALAVIAATPCTAPFMAGAIGVAITQSALITLLIFTALALGFALPLTLLHFAPALQRLIPKPGVWMDRAKQVLAFPMFAAAAWLAWVLAEQAGSSGVLSLLLVASALGLVLLTLRWGRVWLIVGVAILAITGALTWRPLVGVETQSVLEAEAWSDARVTELQGEGRGVFVNFTAAWCISCKANELGALSSERVARAFVDNNVAYLKGDWTNRDDAIAGALARYGRAGVPLYLYFPPEGGEPVILPQVLTDSIIIDTISGAQQ